jgi:2-(1,2-epoxy-1,2-dihydrophenyl)acetyl-CoA isomerase
VGQDLEARSELVDAGATVRDTYNPVVDLLTSMQTPVIAAVNGPAVGAGMGLALSCDAVVMAEDAFFSCAFSKVGLVPDTGTSLALVRALGYAKAFEAAASARRIDAGEALAAGLATELTASGGALRTALGLATEWSQGPGHALGLTKAIFRGVDRQPLTDSLEAEAASQGIAADHPDHPEGVAAFNERRAPRFGATPVPTAQEGLAVRG